MHFNTQKYKTRKFFAPQIGFSKYSTQDYMA